MNRIKKLRLEKGMKQAELAEVLQIAQNTLSYWENGKYEPDNNALIELSKIFEVNIDYLLGNTDNPTPLDQKDEALTISIGKIIKRLREEKKLNQQGVANILGVSRQVYNNYELGKREPDYEMLKKIAEMFNVTTDYLLGASDKPSPKVEKLVIPEEFNNGLFAFHKGDIEDLTQDEVDKISEFIKFVKAQRK